ncbi:hypothetical protein TRAPUB_7604 [Trametes pubescens]|uniref:Uncharacterized protein n=1 Tax=Trametes pubescens TaxID=154538 RepID=A0A1M2V2Z7_TRAPU|nr:hypothetical protein TRAPUB_7604 [Trametes pubescens]
MDAIPPATEQEAISRKMFRRQEVMPVANASAAVRQSPRRTAKVQAPFASTSKARDSGSAKRGAASRSVGQLPEEGPSSPRAEVLVESSISRAGPSGLSRKLTIDASEHFATTTAIDRKSTKADKQNASVQRQAIYSPQPSPMSVQSSSTAGSPQAYHSPWKQGKVYELGREESLSQFGLKPVKAWQPLRATQSTGPSVNEAVISSPRREHHPSAEGRRSESPSLATETLSSNPAAGAAHQPTVTELRAALASIESLADGSAHAQKIWELSTLVDTVEQRVYRMQQKARRVQKLRIALEEHFFAKIKADGRLADGSWTRPDSPEDEEEMAEVE